MATQNQSRTLHFMLFLLLSIFVLSFISSSLPSYFPIKKENSSWPTRAGYTLFFLFLLFLILLIVNAIYVFQNDIFQNVKEKDTKDYQDSLQTRTRRGIDSGILANNEFLAKAFREQGIDIDSLKAKLMENYKDTSENITNYIYTGEIPNVDFEIARDVRSDSIPVKFEYDKISGSYHFRVLVRSFDAASENLRVEINVVSQRFSGKYECPAKSVQEEKIKLGKDALKPLHVFINNTGLIDPIKKVLFKLKCHYTKINDKRVIETESYRSFNIENGTNQGVSGYGMNLFDSLFNKSRLK